MFFQSSKSLFVGILLIPFAGYQLFWGLAYTEAAKRETPVVGTITSVTCGRGCTYDYAFIVNGVKSTSTIAEYAIHPAIGARM